MVIWMYKQLQNTFSADFLTVALYWNGKNSCTIISLICTSLSCHQLETPERMANKGGWQILKPVTYNSKFWSEISHSIVNDSILVTLGKKQTKLSLIIHGTISPFKFCFQIIWGFSNKNIYQICVITPKHSQIIHLATS